MENEFYKKPEETIEEYYARTPTPDRPGEIPADVPIVSPITTEPPTVSRLPETQPFVAESEEEIQARKSKAAQAEIDSLNTFFDTLVAEQRVVSAGKERGVASVSTLTGLAGSTEANVRAAKAADVTTGELAKINQQRAVEINSVLSGIRESATKEATEQREEARLSREEIETNRATRKEEAFDTLTFLSASGTTFEGLKASDPESFGYLARQFGGEEALKGAFVLNRPVEDIIDKRVENGKYIIAYRNPVTGETRLETVDLGIPEGYSKTIDAGDRILAIPDNWDGDPSKLISIDKGLTPAQVQAGLDDVEPEDELEDLDPTSQSILAQTGLSIPAYSFLTTGVKALTRMSSGDRKKFMAEAEEWSISNGVDISTFQSEFQAFNEVVQRNIKISALVGLSGEDIKGSLAELTRLTEKEGFGDVKIKNVLKIIAGEQVGDPVALQYKFIIDDLRSAVSGFFAVQQGRTSTMDSDRADAKELINNGLASGSISGLITTINSVAQRTEQIATDSVGLAQDKIWEMFGVTKPRGGEAPADQFSSERGQLQEGEILIRRDGQVGAVSESEFNPQTDEKL